jgi:hypothetical protein
MGDIDIFANMDIDPLNDPLWQAAHKGKPKRKRMDGPFYQVPEAWADKAAEVCGHYLILALRIYRWWHTTRHVAGIDTIRVTALALNGPCHSRRGRQIVVARLEEAGLIEVVERAAGKAPRIRVIDVHTTCNLRAHSREQV